ncbi:MAG TPA: acyl carrier protein [Acidimicrobiia bacterium]|jgi:acyl carrier protein
MPAETHSHRQPIERAHLEAIVNERLVELLACDPDDVRADARLRADLDADVLVLDDLLVLIDEDLGERSVTLQIDDDDLDELETVADLVDALYRRLDAGSNA